MNPLFKRMSERTLAFHAERVRKMVPSHIQNLNWQSLIVLDHLLTNLRNDGGSAENASLIWRESISRMDAEHKAAEAKRQKIRDTAQRITVELCQGRNPENILSAVMKSLQSGANRKKAIAAGKTILDDEAASRKNIKVSNSLIRLSKTIPKTLWPDQLDVTRLPNPEAFAEAVAHVDLEGLKGGLWLYGHSGTAKTRAAAEISVRACRLALDVDAFTASDLKAYLANVATTGEGSRVKALDTILENISRADVLVIDDIFQTFSISFGECLRKMLDHFNGVLIVTSNFPPDRALELKFRDSTPEILEAVIRRILDRVAVFNFNPTSRTGTR